MNTSKRKLKKAPIPFYHACGDHWENKLIGAFRKAFKRMFGDRYDLNTRERKAWGAFLADRGIHWEMTLRTVPKSPHAWDGWSFHNGPRGKVLARPANLDGYTTARCYFIPDELATRMVVLDDLM